MRTRTFALVVLAAVAAGSASTAAAQAPAAAPPLERTRWRLVALDSLDPAALDAAPRAIIRFVGGRVDGFAGCNQASGGYTMQGDRITLDQLTVTLKKCPEPAMKLENALKEAFAGSTAYAIAGGRLTLAAESGQTMVFEAEPTEPLEGGEWEVTALSDGRGAVASPVDGSQLTLSFRDGAVVGNAGCNLFKAPYQRDSDRLALEPPVATRKSCPAPGVMQQEQSMLALLEKVRTWTIRNHLLELHLAGGELALSARRIAQ
jgi:heat shock protein HslJ